MKITAFIQKLDQQYFKDWTNCKLQADDHIYTALNKFVKSRADFLPVYSNGQYKGAVHAIDIMETIFQKYHAEREKKYQLIKQVNCSLTKLKTLLNNISKSTTPVQRNLLIAEGSAIVEEMKGLLKL